MWCKAAELARWPKLEVLKWCQEEPANQGPWHCIMQNLQAALTPKQALAYAGRPASAFTSTRRSPSSVRNL